MDPQLPDLATINLTNVLVFEYQCDPSGRWEFDDYSFKRALTQIICTFGNNPDVLQCILGTRVHLISVGSCIDSSARRSAREDREASGVAEVRAFVYLVDAAAAPDDAAAAAVVAGDIIVASIQAAPEVAIDAALGSAFKLARIAGTKSDAPTSAPTRAPTSSGRTPVSNGSGDGSGSDLRTHAPPVMSSTVAATDAAADKPSGGLSGWVVAAIVAVLLALVLVFLAVFLLLRQRQMQKTDVAILYSRSFAGTNPMPVKTTVSSHPRVQSRASSGRSYGYLDPVDSNKDWRHINAVLLQDHATLTRKARGPRASESPEVGGGAVEAEAEWAITSAALTAAGQGPPWAPSAPVEPGVPELDGVEHLERWGDQIDADTAVQHSYAVPDAVRVETASPAMNPAVAAIAAQIGAVQSRLQDGGTRAAGDGGRVPPAPRSPDSEPQSPDNAGVSWYEREYGHPLSSGPTDGPPTQASIVASPPLLDPGRVLERQSSKISMRSNGSDQYGFSMADLEEAGVAPGPAPTEAVDAPAGSSLRPDEAAASPSSGDPLDDFERMVLQVNDAGRAA